MKLKLTLSIFTLFLGIIGFSQGENAIKTIKKGDLIKVSEYSNNNVLLQEGYIKNGQLEGVWTSYDSEGNKIAEGSYSNGKKIGVWTFKKASELTEIHYEKNKVKDVLLWELSKDNGLSMATPK